jgi:hypothetical protein
MHVDAIVVHTGIQQMRFNLATRVVGVVDDAMARVSSFETEGEASRVGRERDAEFREVMDAGRTLADDHLDDVTTAQTRPSGQRVGHVQLEGVVGAQDACDPAPARSWC